MQVRESAKLIASLATDVAVDHEQCKRIARQVRELMIARGYGTGTWSTHPLNPHMSDPNVVNWIFTVDTLNFSFWPDNPTARFEVLFNGQSYTGYWSMVAAINRALSESVPITTPAFWASPEFTFDLLQHVFRSDSGVEVPMLNERFAMLKEAGTVLAAENCRGFEDVVLKCEHSAERLVSWVTTHLRSYNDQFVYHGEHEVQFFKRAQILVADLWACFNGCGIGRFDDIDNITMFADYRVPQILNVLGAIRYSQQLTADINAGKYLPSGSDAEVEIRGCAIHSVEVIVDEIRRLERENSTHNHINAILVDFYLWDTAKEQERENTARVECHRTRSVFY